MKSFPLILPVEIRVKRLDQIGKRQLPMDTGISLADEGPGIPCPHPDQGTDLLIAFGFTLPSW
jgi:hypothetical protein